MHFQKKFFLPSQKKFRCIFKNKISSVSKNFFSSRKKIPMRLKIFSFRLEKNSDAFSKNSSFRLEKNFFPSLKKFRCVFQKNLFPFFEKSLRASDKKIRSVIRNPRQKSCQKIFRGSQKKIPCLAPEKNPSRKIFCKKKNLASVKERPTPNEVRNPLTLLPNSSPSFSQKKLILSNSM